MKEINKEALEELILFKNELEKEYEYFLSKLNPLTTDSDKVYRLMYLNFNDGFDQYKLMLTEMEESIKIFSTLLKSFENKKYNKSYLIYINDLNQNIKHSSSLKYDAEIFNEKLDLYLNDCISFNDLKDFSNLGYGGAAGTNPQGGFGGGYGAGGGYGLGGNPISNEGNNYQELLQMEQHFHSLKYNIFDFIHNLSLLEPISSIEGNIVIIGSNGSGKSTLSRKLKMNSYDDSINIIASHHYLYVVNTPFTFEVNGGFTSQIEQYKQEDKMSNSDNEINSDDFIYEFHNILNDLLIQHTSSKSDTYNINSAEESKLETIIKIFNKIIKHRQLIIYETALRVKSGEFIYNLNQLSDGERQVLYFLTNIFSNTEKLYFIIDEPENHLNPQTSKELWDAIESELKHQILVYITHDTNFASSRMNKTIIWSKSFTYPNNWEYEIVEGKNMPEELLLEVLGAKSSILFCEGDYSSDDYKIYSNVYENLKVIPVRGHRNVIDYTKAVNHLQLHIDAYGIIDGDSTSLIEIDKFEKDNIFFLKVNEIEMLYIAEDVIQATLEFRNEAIDDDFIDPLTKVIEFKKAFINEMKVYLEKIVLLTVKDKIDEKLSKEKIEIYGNIESIETSVKRVFESIEVFRFYEKFKFEITNYIDSDDYMSLLMYCNLKKQISESLVRKILTSDYMKYARKRIMHDKELQYTLQTKRILPIINDD